MRRSGGEIFILFLRISMNLRMNLGEFKNFFEQLLLEVFSK